MSVFARGRLAVSAVMLACSLVPCLAHAQSQGAPKDAEPPTQVLLFEPYTAAGLNRDIKIARSVLGECDLPSQVDVNRPDAWACTDASNKQYDPCFANLDGSQLACLELPQVTGTDIAAAAMLSVVILNPASALDQSQANTPGPEATPFLVELVDGQFCVPEPLDVRFASLPVYGYCSAGYWFGAGDLSKPQWTLPILQSGETDSVTSVVNIGVKRVWY
jgi:hypothetical protein